MKGIERRWLLRAASFVLGPFSSAIIAILASGATQAIYRGRLPAISSRAEERPPEMAAEMLRSSTES